MLSLTRKADYALIAMVYLGHQWRKQAGPASARQIADTFGLPGPLLMKTLKELAHADLLRSTRGTAGGYELARTPGEISMLEIVAAVEQDGENAAAAPPQDLLAEPGMALQSAEALRRLHEKIDGFLQGQSLANLLEAVKEGDEPTLVSLKTHTTRRPGGPDGA